MSGEVTMQDAPTLTVYTYASMTDLGKDRWRDRAMPDIFFDNADAARQAVLEARSAFMEDPEIEWQDTCVEKIETIPMTRAAILALLNRGMEAIIKEYEVIETIGANQVRSLTREHGY